MGLGTLDTPGECGSPGTGDPATSKSRPRSVRAGYGPEMAEKAESLRILLPGTSKPGAPNEDTPGNRLAFAKLLAADPDLIDRLTGVLSRRFTFPAGSYGRTR